MKLKAKTKQMQSCKQIQMCTTTPKAMLQWNAALRKSWSFMPCLEEYNQVKINQIHLSCLIEHNIQKQICDCCK